MSSSVDLGVMRKIVEQLFVPVVYQMFGEDGTMALRELLEFLPRHYERANPEQIRGMLCVIRPLKPEGLLGLVSGSSRIETRIEHLPREVEHLTVLELQHNGQICVWENASLDFAAVSAIAVVYRLTRGQEDFLVQNVARIVPNPTPEHTSVFARPTFGTLSDALQEYRRARIRTCTCYIFRDAWLDSNKLFFTPAPEWIMRRSLEQYLGSRIRDVDVLPEQVVDESHPVDIKVLWNFTRSEALIEIKWLGKSRDGDKIVSYWDARALDGAAQLAGYLDKYHTSNPNVDAKGYLVIVDGRRYGLSNSSVHVSNANGMYYEHQEIAYNPRYHEIRSDFEPPVRMFAEPICDTEGQAA